MKIGIVTQTLGHNYGGIIQNYALQQVLIKMGHEPITLKRGGSTLLWLLLRSFRNGVQCLITGQRKKVIPKNKNPKQNNITEDFIKKNIAQTRDIPEFRQSELKRYGIECIITGSDQVWRPSYNGRILFDMFLGFVNRKTPKIAYAASFGVDEWEYTTIETIICRRYARRLNAVSVRERSGIKLCHEYFGIDAIEVIDPTLLLDAEDYTRLSYKIPKTEDKFIAAYILDVDDNKRQLINDFAARKGLSLRLFTANTGIELSVEEWLAMFRDASFVITDSFHGTVFSIIHHKNFITIANSSRGATRFEALLIKFGLENRLTLSFNNLPDLDNIEWEAVEKAISSWRILSKNFLSVSLCKK